MNSRPPGVVTRLGLRRHRSAGFSLLEMMVAIAILGMALGALYQAVSGATRNVRGDEKYAYAVELARSLVADNSIVPGFDIGKRGETAGGFYWRVDTQPFSGAESDYAQKALTAMQVTVGWWDGKKEKNVTLNSVVEVREK